MLSQVRIIEYLSVKDILMYSHTEDLPVTLWWY